MGENIGTEYRNVINKEKEKVNRQSYITISVACVMATVSAVVFAFRNSIAENIIVAATMLIANALFVVFNSVLLLKEGKGNRRRHVGGTCSICEMLILYMIEAITDAIVLQRNPFIMAAVICTAICIGITVSFSNSKLAKKNSVRYIVILMVGVPTAVKLVRVLFAKEDNLIWNTLGFITVEVTVAASIFAMYRTLNITERIAAIEASKSSEFMESADKDGLTGLHNYRRLNKDLSELESKATIMTTVMLDIDNFKKINDTYGHSFGNIVLERLGEILKYHEENDIDGNRREEGDNDFRAYRYGGEEFTLILSNEDAISAEIVLNKLREEIASIKFRENIIITVSVGYSMRKDNLSSDNNKSMIDMLNEADKALYIVKKSGVKNRVLKYSKESIDEEFKTFIGDNGIKSRHVSVEYEQLVRSSMEQLNR